MNMRTIKLMAAATAVALTAAACGDGGDSGGGDGERVIRFAFAPEAVWDMMKDQGVIQDWEEKNNARIETSTTWDEFTYFAGGHGDIVSMSTWGDAGARGGDRDRDGHVR